MPDKLTFSVIIPTFNRNEDLARCLECLNKQTHPDFEVIIANGGDPAEVERTASAFKGLRIKIVNQEKRGLSAGRNSGWQHSSSDIVCFIDDDLAVSPQWMENIAGTFLSDDNIAGVSGPTIIPDDRRKYRDLALFLESFKSTHNIFVKAIGKLYLSIILENRVKDVGRILKSGAFTPGSNFKECLSIPGIIDVDYLEACHMCFRRKLLEELNGFDYIYEGTGEWQEPDLSFKVRQKGYRLVFNPKAVTYHYISQAGVFKDRTNSYERSKNFIFFYMRWVKPDSFGKVMRFGANLLFINLYWCYKFFKTRNPDWLRGIPGVFAGFREARLKCA